MWDFLTFEALSASMINWAGVFAVPLALILGVLLAMWVAGFVVDLMRGGSGGSGDMGSGGGSGRPQRSQSNPGRPPRQPRQPKQPQESGEDSSS